MSAYDEKFYRRHVAGWERSASVIVPMVVDMIRPRSVVDVGCGIGIWLAEFRRRGVERILGLDGDHVDRSMLRIPPECFVAFDLRRQLRLDDRFDLVVSLEVAEHLPADCAEAFVEALARLGDIVLFSAAIPFQGGSDHRNEQWPEYWAAKFAARGLLAVDSIRGRIWSDDRVDWWYVQNTLVYATRGALELHPALEHGYRHTRPEQLSLVHPRKYLAAADPDRQSFTRSLRSLPRLWRKSIARRVRRGRGRDPAEGAP